MTRQEFIKQSQAYIHRILKEHIPPQARIYLYGSRARRDHRWNSDFDFWIDADVSTVMRSQLTEQLEESFVPFKVDIVTTPQLKGHFGERVKREAIPWMPE